ncbi:hypothetical protein CORC01_12258 [Colletotrichum orchidophilum]|uniref:Apple domain-containing protein n=1 Tax=Colletotrichum orchidophilum TaxID=1209926 RepID=A0A1G4ATI1_9PEZI|nr:uncharacterized protein CORC01_12258 [Colletotrichum orchidophilum]OHE92467.1 hypothetical protein CORC01_12258 [Colletotrichum orchidophilum]
MNATCNVEGSIKPGYGNYGLGVDSDNACKGWELCTDARRPPRCQSFSWEPSANECRLFEVSAEAGVDGEVGTGITFYNRDCFVYNPRPGMNTKD